MLIAHSCQGGAHVMNNCKWMVQKCSLKTQRQVGGSLEAHRSEFEF